MNSKQSPLGQIPPEWSLARLKDITTKIGSGATPRGGKEVYLSQRETFALIRSQNVFDRYFNWEGLVYISDEHAEELRQVWLQPDDILLNITGDGITFSRACIIPERVLPSTVNQHVSILRVNPNICDAGFLLSYLTHPQVKHYIESFNSGGSRRAITKGHIESFEIPLPPLREQKAIAAVLSAFDDKIELNRQMNTTLEEMARALFKSWFVDFDPVRRNQEARLFRKSLASAQPYDHLFPDRLVVDGNGREVPDSWRVGTLSEIAKNLRRSIQPDKTDPTTPYIGLQHMPQKSIALTEWGIAEEVSSNKNEFQKGEFLFGKLRPYFHKVGVAPLNGVSSTDILTIAPKQDVWYGLVLGYISNVEFVEYTTAVSTGTRMPRTSWNDMSRYEIIIPSVDVAKEFNQIIKPMVEQIQSNIFESRTLADLRDTLLPRLMSGRLRVLTEPEARLFRKSLASSPVSSPHKENGR